MKKIIQTKFIGIVFLCLVVHNTMAQQGSISYVRGDMQYFRPNDKTGINIFETTKQDTVIFEKLKVRIGGNFTQNFQSLHHYNNAAPTVAINQLIGLKS